MSKSIRVLIVEDLPKDAELAEREILAALDSCEFRRAETREEFLVALKEFRPGLIVSGLKLPSFDGLTALKLTLEHAPDLPFIILTGSMNEDTAVECLKAGAWDYVIKEHVKRLGPAVQSALKQKKLRKKRRKSEEALRKSEEQYRVLADNATDVVWTLDPESGKFTYFSPSVQSLRGYSPAEAMALPIDKTLTPNSLKRALTASRQALEWEQTPGRELSRTILLELEEIRKDGSIVPTEARIKFLRDAQGKPVGLLGITRDITERKQAEKTLRESEEKYRELWEQTRDGIALADLETGILLDCNQAMGDLVGRTREELIGQHQKILHLPASDNAKFFPAFEKHRTDREGGLLEDVLITKAGETKVVEIKATLLTLQGKKVMQGIFRDIAERKRAEEEQEKLQAQFLQAQKMESVGRLAGGVAHDFNNMLQTIIGYCELAFEETAADSPLREDLLEIQKAANRSADLTRQLLAFARKQTVIPRVLDLNETLEGMLKMLRRLIGEDIDLFWKPGLDLWKVKMDPSQIDQILANLSVNARDAISGTGKVTIETENVTLDEAYCAGHAGFSPGQYVQLAVSDDGCGMDPETLEHIFEPFFTTKKEGAGTGLGLSTVYGIAKQNGGFINVYSEPGKGTAVKIYLPRFEGKASEALAESAAEVPQGHGETVLLIEDEESILKLGQKILERLGYTVLSAGTPGEALRLAETHAGEIHLLITDVVMPEMNGRDLAERIVSIKPGLKCLFMSGYTANAITHSNVLDEGMQFIQKPFSLKNLAAKVREVLDQG